ncbi:MAG TPA: hypothetical protein VF268_12065, partial [Gammaproteobacteria bacterium]
PPEVIEPVNGCVIDTPNVNETTGKNQCFSDIQPFCSRKKSAGLRSSFMELPLSSCRNSLKAANEAAPFPGGCGILLCQEARKLPRQSRQAHTLMIREDNTKTTVPGCIASA